MLRRSMTFTARIPIALVLLEETKLYYQRKIKIVASKYNIPKELILKLDQTPLPFICATSHTLHEKSGKVSHLKG